MNRNLKIGLGVLAGILVLAGIAGGSSDDKQTSPGVVEQPTVTTSVAPKQTTTTTEALSSCDAVREALLTGSQATVNSAMSALMADRSESQEARERAAEYLRRVAEYGAGHDNVTGYEQLVANGCELY